MTKARNIIASLFTFLSEKKEIPALEQVQLDEDIVFISCSNVDLYKDFKGALDLKFLIKSEIFSCQIRFHGLAEDNVHLIITTLEGMEHFKDINEASDLSVIRKIFTPCPTNTEQEVIDRCAQLILQQFQQKSYDLSYYEQISQQPLIDIQTHIKKLFTKPGSENFINKIQESISISQKKMIESAKLQPAKSKSSKKFKI